MSLLRVAITRLPASFLIALVIAMGHSVALGQPLEDQVYAIARELMCPVCGGQTVAESSSQLAGQMRDEIRRRLRAGESREEIIAYFVAQFGEGVLAAPPARGGTIILWLAPPLALLAGLAILVRFVRRNLAMPGPA